MYEPRTYRHWIKDSDLVSFNVTVKETDLYIRARNNLKAKALEAVVKCRAPLEEYIESHPLFLSSLEPCSVEEDAPAIVREMAQAAQVVGVGPMATVAGAVAEAVGKDLLAYSPEVIVENGGDIFMKISKTRLKDTSAAIIRLFILLLTYLHFCCYGRPGYFFFNYDFIALFKSR